MLDSAARRFGTYRLCGLLLVAAMWQPLASSAQDINALKAAYIFYFTKFVDWRQPVNGNIVVCVRTDNEAVLRQLQTLEGKSVGGKSLKVKDLSLAGETQPLRCHVLYSQNEIDAYGLNLKDVLVVTETRTASSMIWFSVDKGKLAFEIDANEAGRRGIRISSKLLHLARQVYH